MSDENKEEKTLIEKLKHDYRFIIMNNESFEEVGSYKLSLLNLYILLSTIAVLMALLIFALVIFTPLKRMVPGYGDLTNHSELIRLNNKLTEMEEMARVNERYADTFRKMLVAEVETQSMVESEESVVYDSIPEVKRIKEDELLRQDFELDEAIQEQELLSKVSNISPREIALEQLYFVPPISGEISAGYMSDKHFGVDVMAPKGTPVLAAMDGNVITSDWTVETGNTIGIQHENGVITFYKHNSVLLKESGSFVKAGEAVAIIGNTGTLSNGPHLHFEIWHKGKPVDPEDYVKF